MLTGPFFYFSIVISVILIFLRSDKIFALTLTLWLFQVFTLYTLASRQLSKQSHYDFGLRGLIGLLRYAGIKKRMFPEMGDEEVWMH